MKKSEENEIYRQKREDMECNNYVLRFYLNEKEVLKLRGPGDLEGTQQSGISFTLKIADLMRDNNILFHTRKIAKTLIAHDPKLAQPEHRVLKQELSRLGGNREDWGSVIFRVLVDFET